MTADRSSLRPPGSVPYPDLPPGVATEAFDFDHLVVVMMENHSFDNLLGDLSLTGQPAADGLRFDPAGTALDTNPGPDGPVRAFPFTSTAQGPHASQTWNATHRQINGGAMDGFVASVDSPQPMGYWPSSVLPFAHELARTFTLANRWFCSAPCMTFPNRRFLFAGTAFGGIATDVASLLQSPPPNGTVFDQLHRYGITWKDYFEDFPMVAIIPSVIGHYAEHLATVADFRRDCAAGTLPSVSFVDCEFGLLHGVSAVLDHVPGLRTLAREIGAIGGSEEEPQDLRYGESWARGIVQSVLDSPAWPRTLLIYTYDEHGGYYDHVAPPAAIPPDDIAPRLGAGDAPGGYDIYGVRVPAVVVSPWSRSNAVTDVVHDHTSVLATIEARWNLPALTWRDANAATVADFLDPVAPPFLTPPTLTPPTPTPTTPAPAVSPPGPPGP